MSVKLEVHRGSTLTKRLKLKNTFKRFLRLGELVSQRKTSVLLRHIVSK